MDRQCFEICIKNCEFFILVAHAYHGTTATVTFFTTSVLSRFIGYFRAKKRSRHGVAAEKGGKYNKRGSWTLPDDTPAPRKMSKGNYEWYKFLTSVYFSFIRFERGESIVKKKWDKHSAIFVNNSTPPSLPRNDLKTFPFVHVRCRIFLWNNS